MLLGVLGRPEGGCGAMKRLVRESLEPKPKQRQHKKRALELLRSLWQAGIVEFRSAADGGGIRLHAELQDNFSLLQALGLFVVDAIERLEKDSPSYALDVLGLVEAVIEDPEVILRAQVDKLKSSEGRRAESGRRRIRRAHGRAREDRAPEAQRGVPVLRASPPSPPTIPGSCARR